MHVLDARMPLSQKVQIRAGVRFRVAGNLSGCSLRVAPHDQARTVLERHYYRWIGEDVTQPIVAELELVVTQQGVRLDQYMSARARVVLEAGKRELLGHCVPADDVACLEHDHFEARAGEIGRRDEA